MHPAILAVLPGLIARLTLARNGESPPSLLAGVQISGIIPAADTEFATSSASHSDVVHNERSSRDCFANGRLTNLTFPDQFASGFADQENTAVETDRNDLVFPQRNTAVVDAAAGHVTRPSAISAGIHFPHNAAVTHASLAIDRIDRTPAVCDIEHAVFNNRRAFEIAERITTAALVTAQSDCVSYFQVFGVVDINFFEARKAMTLKILRMQNPVLRLGIGLKSALLSHIGSMGRRQSCRH